MGKAGAWKLVYWDQLYYEHAAGYTDEIPHLNMSNCFTTTVCIRKGHSVLFVY